MEYLTQQEERVFEPSFGYGYLPDEDKPAKPKKTRKTTVQAAPGGETEPAEIRTLLQKPPAAPYVTLAIALLLALLLLVCAIFASLGTVGQVTARVTEHVFFADPDEET